MAALEEASEALIESADVLSDRLSVLEDGADFLSEEEEEDVDGI